MDSIYPWYDGMKRCLRLCGVSPQNLKPQLNHEKNARKNFSRGAFYRISDHYSAKLSRSLKTKKIMRNCHSQELPKEASWLNVKLYPGWGSGTKKGTLD